MMSITVEFLQELACSALIFHFFIPEIKNRSLIPQSIDPAAVGVVQGLFHGCRFEGGQGFAGGRRRPTEISSCGEQIASRRNDGAVKDGDDPTAGWGSQDRGRSATATSGWLRVVATN